MNSNYSDLRIIRALGIQAIPRRAPVIKSVNWTPPPPGWIKVNTDGSSLGAPGPSGCGGIFRTYRGFVKGCFSVALDDGFAFEAELHAFIIAIEKAVEFNWNNLWIESDSTMVINAFMKKTVSIPWKIRNRWLNALKLSNTFNLKVSHIYREGNMVADKLATYSHIAGGQYWWFTHPDFIADLVARDYCQLPFYRFK